MNKNWNPDQGFPTPEQVKRMVVAEADSPNMTMPATNPPTAPTPVHTAYAVPIGIDFMATARSHTLAAIPPTNTASAVMFLNPFDILSATAQMTSNNPATINISQFMTHRDSVIPRRRG